MNKSKLNLIIDLGLLILMAGISGIGFLIKYIMPSGHAIRHEGVQAFASQIAGMNRHGWGDIHWYLSLIFIVFLIAHIVFHWKMILSMFKRLIPNDSLRIFIWVILIVIVFCLMGSPFLFML